MANRFEQALEDVRRNSQNSNTKKSTTKKSTTSSRGSSDSSRFDDALYQLRQEQMAAQKKKRREELAAMAAQKDDIAPVVKTSAKDDEEKWYEKNLIELFKESDIAKKILGVDDEKEKPVTNTAVAPDPYDGMSLEQLKDKMTNTKDGGERLGYTSAYNQKLLEQNAEKLAKTKLNGTDRSVLEEMYLLAEMEKGEEKDKRKEAVISQMEELGIDTKDYALYSSDKNFTWDAFFDWFGSAAKSGLGGFNKGITATVDLILGKPLQAVGWENNPISKLADFYSDEYDAFKYNTSLNAQRLGGGKGYEFAGSAVEGTVGAIPNALLALMTAGASTATTTSTLTSQAAYQAANASGNLLAKAGLTTQAMAKNPQYWLSFAQSYGNDFEEAKDRGMSDEMALLGATVTSLVNARLEVGADGMSGIQGLPAKLKDGDGNAIKEWAFSAIEEGAEEDMQKFVSEMVAATLYGEKDILDPKEYAMDFGIGTISGLALGGGQVGIQSGVNAVQEHQANKLTETEQTVFDFEVNRRVAAKEEKGTKLTNSEKKAIEEKVRYYLEKGYISIETIEEALGGDSYTAYNELVSEADEFKTLYETKSGDLSKKDQDRLAELEAKNKANPYEAALQTAKDNLSQSVFGLAENSRLAESYNERTRRGQAFEADLSKYDTKYHGTIQKAIDSGILNNTNRTHEFVDIIAKISADKGVPFDFTNNAKLKESGFAIDGKQVNGFVTKDGITLNIDSSKAWQSTVGHEITHVLEGTEVYTELQKVLFEYANNKGELDSRKTTLAELYKDIEDADVDAELTADLVGEYLFTDTDFINRLSTEHRNVFQKIYDEIKYLYKVATAGSKEARQLEAVKKAFDEAYRAGGKAQTDTKYSISSDSNGKQLTAEQQEYFKDSKVVDDNGNLLVVYNGSKTKWTVPNKDGRAQWWSASKAYSDNYRGKNGVFNHQNQTTKAYLNIKNPIDVGNTDWYFEPNKWNAGNEQYSEEVVSLADKLGVDIDVLVSAANKHGNRLWNFIQTDEFAEMARQAGFDGIKANEFGNAVYATFSPEQAKNTGNVKPTSDTDIRYSISGKNAKTANYLRLDEAIKMEDIGKASSEEIRQQTGWFRGYDGKWRFEISDRDMEFNIHGFFTNPDVIRYKELENKFVTAPENMTAAEESEMRSLSKSLKGVKKTPKTLGDYIKHDKLFEAYPQLKDIGVSFDYLEGNVVGGYDADRKKIILDYTHRNDIEGIKDTLIHEIQHAVQDIEGFATGSNVEYWKRQSRDIADTIKGAKENLDLWLKDIGYPEYVKTSMQQVAAKEKTLDEHWRDLEAFKANSKYAEQIANSEAEIAEFQREYDAITNGMTPFEQYYNTAGEIEARDVESRLRLSEEERRNKRPDIDRENVVFAPTNSYSLSNAGEATGKGTALKDLALAPVKSEVTPNNAEVTPNAPVQEDLQTTELFPDDLAPAPNELENLQTRLKAIEDTIEGLWADGATEEAVAEYERLSAEGDEIIKRIKEIEADEADRFESLNDEDAPPETEAPIYDDTPVTADDPFESRDYKDIGNRKVKAYQYENPEVKPFFQFEAEVLLGELNAGEKGQRFYADTDYLNKSGYTSHGIWTGQKRLASDDIAYLLDNGKGNGTGYTYDEIRAGLNAIIEDNGKENNACSKRIEFIINDRLRDGYTVFGTNDQQPPNQDYIKLLEEKQINAYSQESFDAFMANADEYAPPVEDIAPVAKPVTNEAPVIEPAKPQPKKDSTQTAKVLTKEPKPTQQKRNVGLKAVSAVVDKGMVFENLSLKTGNMELQSKWDYALPSKSEARAQYLMKNGDKGVKSLDAIRKEVGKEKEQAFSEYLYHVHNIDRMSLDARFGVENKAVFGDSVTAEDSQRIVAEMEEANPEFESWAKDVYTYNKHLRKMLVDKGVISQETSDLWEKMYPHYVPVRRVDQEGLNINVPLDTNKTGVNAPVKRATGGSSDILPLFDTMAQRTIQTYKAIARNDFGVELKNTLNSAIESEAPEKKASVDDVIDSIDFQEELLKPGQKGGKPTFTVFENGERVEFEIDEDMYNALKPANGLLGHTFKGLNAVSNARRNLITSWNPVFALYRNPIKDIQDVLINSQHPAKTYMNVPKAIFELATNGEYAAEYHKNGGDQNTYFESDTNTFKAEDSLFKKAIGMPIRALENAGNFIEQIPRLAEYIASRNDGRSVERSMLDAARVTTNFAAGGDVTKFANRHGFTFLNASVQGASQHVRNIREAKANGLKGWVKLAAKVAVAGLPHFILNGLMWEDDEEYAELSDYVKDNYYIVAKTEDGKFIRIPKGRVAAVIQDGFEQMENLITGDDETDFGNFFKLVIDNLAPNNPIENNILAPIGQAINNKAWYGDELVPSRLQDLPAAEQYDESTDSISKWLGEKTGLSPYKINYLLDQYSGGVGDVFLPMLTPEAESGDDSFKGNMLAPWKKELVTDSVLNNQNVTDFYDLRDELEVNANSMYATQDDEMKNLYMDAVGWDMSDLYKKKREIQNSDMSDYEKYNATRELQKQINEIAKEGLGNYENVNVDGNYSEIGNRRFNYDAEKDKWYEIQAKNSKGEDNWFYIQEQLSHDKLGISYADFWNGKRTPSKDATYYAEYNGKRYDYNPDNKQWYEITPKNEDGSDNYFYQMEQKVTKGLGISYEEYWSKPNEYNYAYEKPGKYAVAKAVGGYDSWMEHYGYLEDWKSENYIGADKDENGKSINGTRKPKVIDYINGLDLDEGEKMILYRTQFTSKADKRAYDKKIVEYLNTRNDIPYQDKVSILAELGFNIDSKGYITW